MLICHPLIFSDEVYVQKFSPFLNEVVFPSNCESLLYILDTNPLSTISFASTVSQSASFNFLDHIFGREDILDFEKV